MKVEEYVNKYSYKKMEEYLKMIKTMGFQETESFIMKGIDNTELRDIKKIVDIEVMISQPFDLGNRSLLITLIFSFSAFMGSIIISLADKYQKMDIYDLTVYFVGFLFLFLIIFAASGNQSYKQLYRVKLLKIIIDKIYSMRCLKD